MAKSLQTNTVPQVSANLQVAMSLILQILWSGLKIKVLLLIHRYMLKILFILFVVVPLVELYVLIEVGSGIGGLTTIALCLFTAAMGGIIIRWQGLHTLIQARQSIISGQQQQLAAHSFHGLLLVIAGILLFFPGFITDAVGFLLLVPFVRNLLMPRYIEINSEQVVSGSTQHINPRYTKVEVIDVEVIKKDK